MSDVVFVLIIIAFFALAAGYVRACARIIGPDEVTTTDLDSDAIASDRVEAADRRAVAR